MEGSSFEFVDPRRIGTSSAGNGPTSYSFGSMLSPSMGLPVSKMSDLTLVQLQESGNEGMARLSGPDL
jgi:hypothetical protein